MDNLLTSIKISDWLTLTSTNIDEFPNISLIEEVLSGEITLRYIRGRKCESVGSLFDEFAAALQFPYYFGENWNAFNDCLNDLAWLPGEKYIFVVTEAHRVLLKSDNDLEKLLYFLRESNLAWSEGRNWAYGEKSEPKQMSFVFQCESSKIEQLAKRIEHLGYEARRIG